MSKLNRKLKRLLFFCFVELDYTKENLFFSTTKKTTLFSFNSFVKSLLMIDKRPKYFD
jgi:hypothetical protein